MALAKARVSMPAKATQGEVIKIKTLIRHRMETGYRVDTVGKSIPRDIVTKLTVTYGGVEVFAWISLKGWRQIHTLRFIPVRSIQASLFLYGRTPRGHLPPCAKR